MYYIYVVLSIIYIISGVLHLVENGVLILPIFTYNQIHSCVQVRNCTSIIQVTPLYIPLIYIYIYIYTLTSISWV
ncbi:hypothetical protein QBC46DRAFT_33386 [Diplogelasinospora grovesii]|uniref:Uncharacterized protein n=1 Tax=Diplogelasinospora grovesii TaxID=303347 RepID=A0AAN6S701_9PEZI|nr:hypothetical protein QBC46DRAFT_33386 [Diplogelasinospora grovesii]